MESFTLASEVAVRAMVTGPVRLRVLRPSVPSVGVGVLRVLHVRERDGTTELLAGYDRYERIVEPRT